MKILIMGLPGSGKTRLARKLVNYLKIYWDINPVWFNGENVRQQCDDWDFSLAGRERQAKRMRVYADFECSNDKWVICDFVAPTIRTRQLFDADYVIWINTIKTSWFEDTNTIFEPPKHFNLEVTETLTDNEVKDMADKLVREWQRMITTGIFA